MKRFSEILKCCSQTMRALLSQYSCAFRDRLPRVVWDVFRLNPALRTLYASLPWFCIRLDFCAYYTQEFALKRPLDWTPDFWRSGNVCEIVFSARGSFSVTSTPWTYRAEDWFWILRTLTWHNESKWARAFKLFQVEFSAFRFSLPHRARSWYWRSHRRWTEDFAHFDRSSKIYHNANFHSYTPKLCSFREGCVGWRNSCQLTQ